jgi:hypothetical protein
MAHLDRIVIARSERADQAEAAKSLEFPANRLDKIRNWRYKIPTYGIIFPLAGRRAGRRETMAVDLQPTARAGTEERFSLFSRPQPIEKARFAKINASKR